jgi:hypothetical protein
MVLTLLNSSNRSYHYRVVQKGRTNGHIFIGGAGRSGTTLVRVLLDAHSRICCGPEMKILQDVAGLYQVASAMPAVTEGYANSPVDLQKYFREFVENLSANFRRNSGKPRWAEKTPHNVRFMAPLGSIFPEARFIHVIRDGRDVACSLVTMDWKDFRTGKKLEYLQSIRNAAKYWREVVRRGQQQAAEPHLRDRVMEVRYEALVTETEQTMRKVLDFLGEEWEPGILNAYKNTRNHEPGESSTEQVTKPVYNTSVGRWKREIPAEEKPAFKFEAGLLLQELGYVRDDNW